MDIASLFNNPTFTGFFGAILVFIGGCINQLIDWRKDVSLVREKSRMEYLKTAVEDLKKFLEKATINIADINESHEEHARRVRDFYERLLRGNDQKTMKEWEDFVENYHPIIVAYMSTRHLLSREDRKFLTKFINPSLNIWPHHQ